MRIFFLHSGNEQFVKIDRDLLSDSNIVLEYHASRKFPFGVIQYWRGIKESDILFCWFASWNSFWALLISKLFQKPSILVIGGYDIANLPAAKYGLQRGGIGKWISRLAMKLATSLFTNSYYSQGEAEKNAGLPPGRVHVIYHGVPDTFGHFENLPRERIALTVGKVEWANLKRKGLEPFVRVAAFFPDVQFILVGAWIDGSIEHLRSIATPNVLFTGRVNEKILIEYYNRTSVYVQASMHEGFGMSLAEAMLGGCIPVVTNVGALPEVVGNFGVKFNNINVFELKKAIDIALMLQEDERTKIRDWILQKFPLQQRKIELYKIINEVLNK